MPLILEDLPFADVPYDLALSGGGSIRIGSRQIVFWATVTRKGLAGLPPNAPRMPSVFDSISFRTLSCLGSICGLNLLGPRTRRQGPSTSDVR